MRRQLLTETLGFARERSPFYCRLHRDVAPGETRLAAYPIIDQREFWAANTVDDNGILTGPMEDGIVFKSGGTTGSPKYSFFSRGEWAAFTKAFGGGMAKNGLRPGERVANLFYAGELYASFLFIGRSLEEAGVGVCYPMSGAAPLAEMVDVLRRFRIETVAGVPTTILRLVDHVTRTGATGLAVRKVLFGGESMYADQRQALRACFAECEIRSVGIASVDGGEIGYADLGCEPEEHRAFDATTVLELVDDDRGEPVEEAGRPGRLIVTNLVRRLMPLIRYPVGDRAVWVDPPGTPDRRFRLLGRADEGARVGPVTLYVEDVLKVLGGFRAELPLSAFQIIVDHRDGLDGATVRVAVPDPAALPPGLAGAVVLRLYAERHFYQQLVEQGLLRPLAVEWVTSDALTVNPRTGKLRRVIDTRLLA
jgi:phenylacetate-CoA ligase